MNANALVSPDFFEKAGSDVKWICIKFFGSFTKEEQNKSAEKFCLDKLSCSYRLRILEVQNVEVWLPPELLKPWRERGANRAFWAGRNRAKL